MSQQLVIGNRSYTSSSILARQFSYTADYLSKLARDGKVEATRVGRKWYINEDSLTQFITELKSLKEEKNHQLRISRKKERQSFVDTTLLPHVKMGIVSPPRQFEVILQSVAVLLCGALVGLLSFTIFTEKISLALIGETTAAMAAASSEQLVSELFMAHSFQNQASLDFSHFFSWLFGGTISPSRSDRSHEVVMQPPAVHNSLEVNVTDVPIRPGIVVFNASTTAADVSAVRDSFSDPVEVSFEGEDVGVITPLFKNRDGEPYRFLIVPVVSTDSVQ